MKIGSILYIFCFLSICVVSHAQEELPEFQLTQSVSGKISISWHNPNKNTNQLMVQRSTDNKNFKTIITARKPGLYENSFTDSKFPKNKELFYRIQYSLKNGKPLFSRTHSTRETEANSVQKKEQNPKSWKASSLVFTNKNGAVQILLKNPTVYQYRLVFFEETGKELFQMNKIQSDNLILDNANFMHKGWFLFELYKDEQLLEKNKVLVNGNF